MARHRSSQKRAGPEIGLYMECIEEELEPCQIRYFSKADKEYTELHNKLDNCVKTLNAEVIEMGEHCVALQIDTRSTSDLPNPFPVSAICGKSGRQSAQGNQSYQHVVGAGILTRSTSGASGSAYLVVDSSLNIIQMPSTHLSLDQPGGCGKQPVSSGPVLVSTGSKSGSKRNSPIASESEILTSPITRTRDKTKSQSQAQQVTTLNLSSASQEQVYTPEGGTVGGFKLKVNTKQVPTAAKPGENNAFGGLMVGNKLSWKLLSDELTTKATTGSADSKEVTFNKVVGKTFPSLVVTARPNLKVKFIPQSKISQERTALDARVKGVLMFTATKFTEWLIQQGLIKSEQTCQNHVNGDVNCAKLKLGMYSDTSKFPYSGGYVWISDCCPNQFVSVFSGSIFEGAPHSPTTLLKLIYHWACQTNVQNIVQWVKVDNMYVKNFFANMRAVCTQAVHEKFKQMGGPKKKIEVGVISLGTTSQDGNKRQVKVEVLGVLDHENKLIRLRAVEPHSDERSFKRRFVRILQPLEDWVSKDSTILTDFTVNKAALNSLGFNSVYQVTSDVKYSNQNVMEYLRRIVPRMFQNTLSLLSRQIIQQFLDELVWREIWGPTPSQAFVNIIAHMAEQTKLDVNENYLVRLHTVAANPFKDWNYSVWSPATSSKEKDSPALSVSPEYSCTAPAEFMSSGNPSGKSTRTRKRGSDVGLFASETSGTLSPSKKINKVPAKEKAKKEERMKERGDKIGKREKELEEEVLKFIEEGDQISVAGYYYGTRRESSETFQAAGGGRLLVDFGVKCCVCNKRFSDNIILMKHMVLHCQSEPALVANIKSVHQCETCFLGLNTRTELEFHLKETHAKVGEESEFEYLCRICEKKFLSRPELIFHMHSTHVEKELPYECGVCHFRSSIYGHLTEHFVQAHRGEGHVFCPFCLKVVTLSHAGVPIDSNVHFYFVHLEKHHRQSLTVACPKCCLSFIHRGILDQHLEADHGSWKGEPGLDALAEDATGPLMPEPGTLIKSAAHVTRSPRSPRSQKAKAAFTLNKFKTLQAEGFDENATCVECEEFLLNTNHFTGDFACLNCRYATCCERAMIEHVTIFHEVANPRFTMGRPTVLDKEMFCVCGYSNRSGNKMAKHLGICENKCAYACLDSAVNAVRSASEEDNAKTEGGQNVLNMLGLIRKSPDRFVSDESKNNYSRMSLAETSGIDIDETGCTSDLKSSKENVKKESEYGTTLGFAAAETASSSESGSEPRFVDATPEDRMFPSEGAAEREKDVRTEGGGDSEERAATTDPKGEARNGRKESE